MNENRNPQKILNIKLKKKSPKRKIGTSDYDKCHTGGGIKYGGGSLGTHTDGEVQRE
jgi:hypothetical protein